MSKNLFITGTGTDAGKNPGYYKAAMSGNKRQEDGTLIPGDALWVQKTAGIRQPLIEMCPYVYENAYSPHLASRIEGNPVQLSVVKQGFDNVCRKYDYVTMEGSGGILCPICFDEAKIQLEDVIQTLDLSCLIIANAGLGTINSVVLTVEYMCEYMTGLKVLACIRDGDTELCMDADSLAALYD